jgi:predicted component of type VI protein secretion system
MDLDKDGFGEDEDLIVYQDNPDLKKLKDHKISTIQIIQNEKEVAQNFLELIDKLENHITPFVESITLDQNGKRFMDTLLESLLDERDLTGQEGQSQQSLSDYVRDERRLLLDERKMEIIISHFIEAYPSVPDHIKVREKIKELLEKIISKKIYYHTKMGFDPAPIERLFANNFESFFGELIEKELFEEEIKIDSVRLDSLFNKREFEDKSSAEFPEFKFSVYKYNKFDSKQELAIARLLEKVMGDSGSEDNFWIKNGRRIEYTLKIKGRGQHEYNPDFIVYFEERFYVIEVKGTGLYYDEFVKRRNKEKLELLAKFTSDVTPVLLISTTIDARINPNIGDFKQILEHNDLLRKEKGLEEFK